MSSVILDCRLISAWVCEFTEAAVTKDHSLVGLINQNLFCHGSRGQSPKSRCLQGSLVRLQGRLYPASQLLGLQKVLGSRIHPDAEDCGLT